LTDWNRISPTRPRWGGKKYRYILDKPYRWESWAAPKGKEGTLDHNKALTGDDLRDFVNNKLFPNLYGFKQKASGPNTIEYKIGEIFGEIKNKIQSGYNMRELIDHIDELRFRSQAEKHELSHLYEAKIKNMGNAGRNGGEYYTPRPLIRAIVQVAQPRLGERICDGAVGSAGFLCEAYEYLKETHPKRITAQGRTLQQRTFYGKEKKSLAYVIAIMNMILHGIEAPNILHTNTLTENLADIQEKDRYDVVLANPPFGGKERKEVQQNFPIRTGETAFLFLQHTWPTPCRRSPAKSAPHGPRSSSARISPQTASLPRLRAIALRQRRRARARSGQADAPLAAEVPQLHRRCSGRSGKSGGDRAGLRRLPEIPVSATGRGITNEHLTHTQECVNLTHEGRPMRTNIDIDDRLMRQAMRSSDARTKRAVVEEALRLLIQTRGQSSIRHLRGNVNWEGNLQASRSERVAK
jgi:Arc/MetJ family transcription regulator